MERAIKDGRDREEGELAGVGGMSYANDWPDCELHLSSPTRLSWLLEGCLALGVSLPKCVIFTLGC